jgi:hypothetical protein
MESNKPIIKEAIAEMINSTRIDISWRISRLKKYLQTNDNNSLNDFCISDNYLEKTYNVGFTHCDECEKNGRRIYFKDFKDVDSVKEYILSGMSLECQKDVFDGTSFEDAGISVFTFDL